MFDQVAYAAEIEAATSASLSDAWDTQVETGEMNFNEMAHTLISCLAERGLVIVKRASIQAARNMLADVDGELSELMED